MDRSVPRDDGWWKRCPYLVQQLRAAAAPGRTVVDVAPYTCKLGSGLAAGQHGGRALPVACAQSHDAYSACPHIANPLVRLAARLATAHVGGLTAK